MRQNILSIVLIALSFSLFFNTPSFASQCITYEGYKRLNTNPDQPVCKLKYTTLEFGPKNFCDKEKSCTPSGLPSLQKSISYRKNDIQRLQTCMAEIEKGDKGDLVHKCPSYKDIYNLSVLDGGIKPKRELVERAISTLENEIRQIETISEHIKRNTIRSFLTSFDNGVRVVAECITTGIETTLSTVNEGVEIANGALQSSAATLQNHAYQQQVETDRELGVAIEKSIEDQFIERIKSGELKVPEIVRDIQSGKIGKEEGERILARILSEVPKADESIRNANLGMALAHLWAGGEEGKEPTANDLKAGMSMVNGAIKDTKFGPHGLATEALRLAREKGDTAKANEIATNVRRLIEWQNNLNNNGRDPENNPVDFLLTVSELQRQSEYFASVVAEYRGEEIESERTKFYLLEKGASAANGIADGAKYVGTMGAALYGPAAATTYYASVNEAQGAIRRFAGQEHPVTLSDIPGKAIEYGAIYFGTRILTPKAVEITVLPTNPNIPRPLTVKPGTSVSASSTSSAPNLLANQGTKVVASRVAGNFGHATSLFRNGPLTNAGRALAKHPNIVGESGNILQKLGGAARVNEVAASALRNIMEIGKMTIKTTKNFGEVIEYKLESGLGARFSKETGEFIGFLGRGL